MEYWVISARTGFPYDVRRLDAADETDALARGLQLLPPAYEQELWVVPVEMSAKYTVAVEYTPVKEGS